MAESRFPGAHEEPIPLVSLEQNYHENLNEVFTLESRSSTRGRSYHESTEGLHEEAAANTANEETVEHNVPKYPQGLEKLTIVSTTVMMVFLMLVDTSILSTAVTDEFQSLGDIGWYASVYQLASATLQLPAGQFYHLFSTKWTLLVYFIIFELGSLLCGLSNSSTMLIVSRAVAGIGASGLMTGALTIISCISPPEKRPAITGITMGLSQMGTVLGPVIGGAITEYASWRWCFLVNIPFGAAVGTVYVFPRIPEMIRKDKALNVLRQIHKMMDLGGVFFSAPFAVLLLLALELGNTGSWYSLEVFGFFCGSAASFVLWMFWNWMMGEHAIVPLSMVKRNVVWFSSIIQWCLMTSMLSTSYFMSIYFQAIVNLDAFTSGVYLLPAVIGQVLFAGLGGSLVQWTGYVIPYSVFSGILISIGSGLLSTLTPSSGMKKWFGYQLITGIGRGFSIQMPAIAVQSAVASSQVSIALSFMIYVQSLGSAIFLTVANIIFDTTLVSDVNSRLSSLDGKAILEMGATNFRDIVAEKDVPQVVFAYAKGLQHVSYFATAFGLLMVFVAPGMGWVDVRRRGVTGADEGIA